MMKFLKKENLSLAYTDTQTSLPAVLLIHGCGCDHTHFAPLAELLSPYHRVVNVDLRGHGESDAPHNEYTMASLADDLAWLCGELRLEKPVAIGHSMGGNVGLELSARHPDLLRTLVMVDSVVVPSQPVREALAPLDEVLQKPDYLSAFRQLLSGLCLPTDKRSFEVIASVKVPQHVVISTIKNHATQYDASSVAAACLTPIAYIGAAVPLADLDRFRTLTPQLVTAHVLGSVHFIPLEVPDQLNAMISRFLANLN